MPARALAVLIAATFIIAAMAGGAPASSRTRVVSDCQHSHYKPRTFVVACGDGNYFLTRIHWRHWGRHYAYGVGYSHRNDCNPNCAQGHFTAYRASIKLTRRGLCQTRGDLEYHRFTTSDRKGRYTQDVYPSCD